MASDRDLKAFHVPPGRLPAMGTGDLPAPPTSLQKIIGPSVILLSLMLGSGELILWPGLSSKFGIAIIWAALIGLLTQYFMNMEIERWSLATGESVVTGMSRLSAWVPSFLVVTAVLPYIWPGWASGGGAIMAHLIGGDAQLFAIISLWMCGLFLTLGPVVYVAMERLQMGLMIVAVPSIMILAASIVTAEDIAALVKGTVHIDWIWQIDNWFLFLGALAFAGVGGVGNLVQSMYIRDKRYGMGFYAPRITSPITGVEEAASNFGVTFPLTRENIRKWNGWWRLADREHFGLFFGLGGFTMVLLALLAYSITRDGGTVETINMAFLFHEIDLFHAEFGSLVAVSFAVVGIIIMIGSEIGALDQVGRVVTEILFVNYLRKKPGWTLNRIYFICLWSMVLIGTIILGLGFSAPVTLLVTSACLNAFVMFFYCIFILYINYTKLPVQLRTSRFRVAAMVWAILFFGFFSGVTIYKEILPRIF